ncbi:cupredoxin domain-containing protein [Alkalihalobacillus sp. CinArs1]|uniref:cupredoxin domain-containing protein n=1 Tax=Alkalihalobacillus sp. CinArs1 TaxID=2995314 RepID=UPI0022DCEEAF|nr:cupredoxin domain-containing protein [Alkalihalobacillus sp. CinArs1]
MLLVAMFGLFFYTFEQFNFEIGDVKSEGEGSSVSVHEHEKGSLGAHKNNTEFNRPTVVIATDFSYSPAIIRVEEGRPFTLILKNEGNIEHDLEITNSNGKLVHLHVQPGEEAIENVLLPKGTYQFVCSVPGHKEAGMFGSMVVS